MKTLPLTTKDDKSAALWADLQAKNQDPYGFGCIEVISKLGKNLDDGMNCAEAESQAIKGSGITGFMMAIVAQTIWTVHPRGDEFKRYFNESNGVEADAPGIVNPAIMTVGGDEK